VSFQFRAHALRRTAASYMGEGASTGSTLPTCWITAAWRIVPPQRSTATTKKSVPGSRSARKCYSGSCT